MEISSLCVIFLPLSELENNRTSFLSEGEARRGVDYSSPSPFEGEGWGEGFAKINPSS